MKLGLIGLVVEPLVSSTLRLRSSTRSRWRRSSSRYARAVAATRTTARVYLSRADPRHDAEQQGRIETPAQSSTGSTGGDSVFLIDEDAELEALEATTAASPPKPAAASAPTATPSTPQQQQQARSSFGIWDSPSSTCYACLSFLVARVSLAAAL